MTTRPNKHQQSINKTEPMAGVILCAGKGTRMGDTDKHKVCQPILGRPAVVRLIDVLRADGVSPIVAVVGHRSGDVVETVGAAHPGVHFVYQRDRLGTGHAARVGLEALSQFGYSGTVLVTMGDKWLAPGVAALACRRFVESGARLLAVSTPKRRESTAGRFVRLPGRGIVGIVELRDVQRARLLKEWLHLASHSKTLSKNSLRRTGLTHISPARKLWRALGPLARFCRGSGNVQASELAQVIREKGVAIRVGGRDLGPDQVERWSPTVNESVYLADAATLLSALHRVGRGNAQDEYYLTDVVGILSADASSDNGKKAVPPVIEHRSTRAEVMAFNTRAELRQIAERVKLLEKQASRPATGLRGMRNSQSAHRWLELLATARGEKMGRRIYGQDAATVRNRLHAMRRLTELFIRSHGDRGKMLLVRAPGRINLMGRHIDHQGGFVHSMALDCEVLMAARPRSDDVIRLVNADPVSFPARELVLGDWMNALQTPDWLSFVDGPAVRTHLMSTAGDWSNYVLASALYQQYRNPGRRLVGMDVAVSGNIPMAAGLSSSSALVVASMEAITAVNDLPIDGPELVSACGQAEWFVGSRGGSADHAAIRLAQAGRLARMSFHPFRLVGHVPLPPDAAVLIAYSGEHATKSAGARDRFNERVACYRLGVLLLQRMYPRLASKMQYIRDVSPWKLRLSAADVLKMVNALPNNASRAWLRRELGARCSSQLDRIFASHADPGTYTVRDVVTYGVGECERSRIAAEHLRGNDLAGLGDMMRRSHDGDRVSGLRWFEEGSSDDLLSAPLHNLIGAYRCSTQRLDRLVDLACAIPGVYGAQLAGAGLGGCVMILAERQAVRRVRLTLSREYYQPQSLAPAIWHVRSAPGGGVIRFR